LIGPTVTVADIAAEEAVNTFYRNATTEQISFVTAHRNNLTAARLVASEEGDVTL